LPEVHRKVGELWTQTERRGEVKKLSRVNSWGGLPVQGKDGRARNVRSIKTGGGEREKEATGPTSSFGHTSAGEKRSAK